jgi:hypothetical protein
MSILRGALIFPMVAELARLNTAATRAASKYDDDFKTLKPGQAPTYHTAVRLKAQVEMGAWQSQNQLQAGNAPDSRLTLVFHFSELETLGLIDATNGGAMLRVGDKLLGIYDRSGTRLEHLVSEASGGLFATEVQPGGIGLGGRRNLLVMSFEQRGKGLSSNP